MHDHAEHRAAIVREALSWLKTPYHHHGRVKGEDGGVDCLMLLAEVFERTGFAGHVDPGFYAHDWHLNHTEERYAQGLASYVRRLPDGESPQPGDIGLWHFGLTFSHGGIVVDEGPLVLHACLGHGVILTRATEFPLAGRAVQWWSALPASALAEAA